MMGRDWLGIFWAGKAAEGTEAGEKDSEKRKDLDADFWGLGGGFSFDLAHFSWICSVSGK